ncbi:hypothetical protein phiOC_p282 [Ochrobactrum phage vB_OspM_OC]|nr:hypothetical protein phiOC_p282 [Ochrobactrum phage vB_OspM_OC]
MVFDNAEHHQTAPIFEVRQTYLNASPSWV